MSSGQKVDVSCDGSRNDPYFGPPSTGNMAFSPVYRQNAVALAGLKLSQYFLSTLWYTSTRFGSMHLHSEPGVGGARGGAGGGGGASQPGE